MLSLRLQPRLSVLTVKTKLKTLKKRIFTEFYTDIGAFTQENLGTNSPVAVFRRQIVVLEDFLAFVKGRSIISDSLFLHSEIQFPDTFCVFTGPDVTIHDSFGPIGWVINLLQYYRQLHLLVEVRDF